MANTKVTSRVLANDAVLTANIADDQVTTAKIADDQITSALVADDIALGGNPTTTTQSAGNNTTRIATTAFVSTAVSNLVDSSPSALNTLNELAAALGDDANFSTTVTNSIATKLPLAGGTMTGNIVMADDTSIGIADDAERIEFDGAGDINILGANLGIGTTSPAYLLQLQASTDTDLSIISGTSSGDFGSILFGDTDYAAEGRITYQNSDNKMRFWSDRQHVMTLDDNARVGIGTESPSDYWSTANALVVRESDNSTGITIATGTSNTGQIYFADGTSGDAQYRGWLNYEHGTDTMSLATAASTKVTILSSGNVGIGTDDPKGVLHVHGGDSGSSYTADGADKLIIEHSDSVAIDLRTPASNQAIIMFSDGTRSQGLIGYNHSNDSLRFSNSGNQTRMTINSDGSVTLGGALSLGDTITHGNGVLDLYDGGSNTSLTNGVTNGNVKIQSVVSGVGIAAVIRAGDSALGQVDLPYQSGFHANSPAVTNGGGNVIIFGGTHHNTGSDYSTTTGRYTAPRTGRYLISASVLMNPGSTTSYERILFGVNQNAASTQFGDTLCIPGNTNYEGLNITVVLTLGAGDYVQVYNMGESPTYGTSYGSFSGFYLG